jgi:hypothetical protein
VSSGVKSMSKIPRENYSKSNKIKADENENIKYKIRKIKKIIINYSEKKEKKRN